MKRLIVWSFIFFPTIGYCQHCIISNTKENVVYIGIPNPIDVAVEDRRCKDFSVVTDNGKIEAAETACSYTYNPSTVGKAEITVRDKQQGKVIRKCVFRVKNIPPPVAMLAGKSEGVISRSVLKVQIGLAAVLNGFDFDARFVIDAYTVSIVRNGKSFFVKSCEGARFPQDVLDAFGRTEKGDRLIFAGIRYRSPADKQGAVQPIEFEIVN